MLFNDLALFVTVAQELSFSKSAQRLSLPASSVSRRIADLEDHLGVKLLERTTRRVRLTEEGRRLLDRCLMPIETLRELGGTFSEGARSTLRLTAPSLATRTSIGPKLLDFAMRYTDLAIDLISTNSNLDFIRDNIDLAFRISPITNDSLIARPLWTITYDFCVGKEFSRLHGLKKTISRKQLLALPAILCGTPWYIEEGSPVYTSSVAHTFSELDLVMEAVRRNLGIALLPTEMLTDDVVVIAVNGVTPTKRIMNAVYPSKRLLPSRVRLLIDYMSVQA